MNTIKLANGFRPVLFAEPVGGSKAQTDDKWVSPVAGQVAKGLTDMLGDWSRFELSRAVMTPQPSGSATASQVYGAPSDNLGGPADAPPAEPAVDQLR